VLVAEYLSRLDGFVQLVGVYESLALYLEKLDLAFLDKPVEGGAADLEMLAGFFTMIL
jgi:hypothetical protein